MTRCMCGCTRLEPHKRDCTHSARYTKRAAARNAKNFSSLDMDHILGTSVTTEKRVEKETPAEREGSATVEEDENSGCRVFVSELSVEEYFRKKYQELGIIGMGTEVN
jgi:hypothetical protein